MYVYARVNKETLRCIREKKSVSFDYITRMTNLPQEKVALWEDESSGKYPTIKQAKAIAKCYRIPFAGLYMNFSDINVKHLPPMRNLRTLPNTTVDDSALNLAIADIMSARELLIESKMMLLQNINPHIRLLNRIAVRYTRTQSPDDNRKETISCVNSLTSAVATTSSLTLQFRKNPAPSTSMAECAGST